MGAGVEFEASPPPTSRTDLRVAIGVLLRRAQDAGAVRPDVTAASRGGAGGRDLPGGRARRRTRRTICSPSSATACVASRPVEHRLPRSGRPVTSRWPASRRLDHLAVRVDGAVQRESAVAFDHLAGHPPMACSARMISAMSTASPSRPSAVRPATPASQGEPVTVADGPRPSIGVRGHAGSHRVDAEAQRRPTRPPPP